MSIALLCLYPSVQDSPHILQICVGPIPLAHLGSLCLGPCNASCRCEQISDDGLEFVGQLPNLTALDLARCYHITDDGLFKLQSLSKLASLNLTCCEQVTPPRARQTLLGAAIPLWNPPQGMIMCSDGCGKTRSCYIKQSGGGRQAKRQNPFPVELPSDSITALAMTTRPPSKQHPLTHALVSERSLAFPSTLPRALVLCSSVHLPL